MTVGICLNIPRQPPSYTEEEMGDVLVITWVVVTGDSTFSAEHFYLIGVFHELYLGGRNIWVFAVKLFLFVKHAKIGGENVFAGI